MIPKVDGVKVLEAIREYEVKRGVLPEQRVNIIMTIASAETGFVKKAFDIGCKAYAAKTIDTNKMREVMKKLGLIA